MSSTHIIPKSRRVLVEETIHIIECAGCSVDFGIGANFMAKRREDHGNFYCPNGHTNWYPDDNELEKKAKKLEAELAATLRREQAVRRDREWQREQRLKAERQRAAAKGQLTKTKNRIANGVCPCCNRTFVNVGKHMAGQHPDYVGTEQ